MNLRPNGFTTGINTFNNGKLIKSMTSKKD